MGTFLNRQQEINGCAYTQTNMTIEYKHTTTRTNVHTQMNMTVQYKYIICRENTVPKRR